mgnify:CR=1 FL=1
MKRSAYAVLGTAAGFSSLGARSSGQKSRVVLIRHKDALDENLKFNKKIIPLFLCTFF